MNIMIIIIIISNLIFIIIVIYKVIIDHNSNYSWLLLLHLGPVEFESGLDWTPKDILRVLEHLGDDVARSCKLQFIRNSVLFAILVQRTLAFSIYRKSNEYMKYSWNISSIYGILLIIILQDYYSIIDNYYPDGNPKVLAIWIQ